jgi:hypothetical protein
MWWLGTGAKPSNETCAVLNKFEEESEKSCTKLDSEAEEKREIRNRTLQEAMDHCITAVDNDLCNNPYVENKNKNEKKGKGATLLGCYRERVRDSESEVETSKSSKPNVSSLSKRESAGTLINLVIAGAESNAVSLSKTLAAVAHDEKLQVCV